MFMAFRQSQASQGHVNPAFVKDEDDNDEEGDFDDDNVCNSSLSDAYSDDDMSPETEHKGYLNMRLQFTSSDLMSK